MTPRRPPKGEGDGRRAAGPSGSREGQRDRRSRLCEGLGRRHRAAVRRRERAGAGTGGEAAAADHRRQLQDRPRRRLTHRRGRRRAPRGELVAQFLGAMSLSASSSRTALTRLLTSSASARPSLRKITLMCFSIARLLRYIDCAIAALLLALRDLRQHLELARGELLERVVLGARPGLRELLDDLRIDQRAALGHRADRCRELRSVVHAILEQIGPAVRAVLEQRQGVGRRRELAQDHDADLRVALAELLREADALVGLRRWHPDVGDDDVRWIGVAQRKQGVVVARGIDHLDRRIIGQQAANPLADQQVVLAEHDADRHAMNLWPPRVVRFTRTR